tara:strand:- start:26 stop:1009 length:984 start_codon:yes stop_codon:yes gene_type:complete
MKYLESHFDEYIKLLENCSLNNINDNIKSVEKIPNYIIYGPPGIGKYTKTLHLIKPLSPSNLKYEKKIIVACNKSNYNLKISDIHYEIDLSLLGCNSKIIWHDLYLQIYDIISSNNTKNGIIVCKNFQNIHSELLEIFYSYMQNQFNAGITIKFFIITTDISFIPDNILNCCKKLIIPRPSKTMYNKCFKIKIDKSIDINNINNIKDIKDFKKNNTHTDIKDIEYIQLPYKNTCNKIIELITNYNDSKFIQMRELLYDICIFEFNIFDVLLYIINELVNLNYINSFTKYNNIVIESYNFIKLYNNNYRPIYHLERYILYIISIVHEL